MSYHASGVKPTDIASWVGAGWSISGGGQITRQVNGKPDDEHYLTHPLNPEAQACYDLQYLKLTSAGTFDTEPDVFSYSYSPGRSGKFLLPNGGTYVSLNGTAPNSGAYLVPYAPIVVKRLTDQNYQITEENGVLYRFGTSYNGISSTEFTTSTNGGAVSLSATTSWNLMDIVAPNSSDSISFKYQDVGTAERDDVSYTYLFYDLCFADNGATCPGEQHQVPKKISHQSRVNQQGFDEIIFETGKIKFVLGSLRSDAKTLKFLDRIEIYNTTDALPIKSIQFLYSYFKDANNAPTALKLDAVHFLDNAKVPIQKYKFTYFTDSFSWNRSHVNFLNARDLWGYYNGALANTDLMLPKTVAYQPLESSPSQNVVIGGALNRSVNTAYAKEGILSRIDFPTGGYSEFDYESNKYISNESGTPVETYAGGLRIKKITSLETATGVPVVKQYKYGAGESGIGTALFVSNYYNNSSSQLYSAGCEIHNPILSFQIRTYHSYSSYAIESASPVVYSSVTEYLGDPAGANNGKTIYNYDVGGGDVNHFLPSSTKSYTNTNAWRRGKLIKKSVYDNIGNKISTTGIEYDTYKEDSKLVGVGSYLYMAGVNPCFGTPCFVAEANEYVHPQTFKTATYTQNTGALLESKVTDTLFDRGSTTKYLVTKTEKIYHADKLQIVTTKSTSGNSTEETVTVNTYPFQLSANAASTGNAKGVYMLSNKNIVSIPIETYCYFQKPDNTNRRIVGGTVTTYRQSTSNPKHVVPDQIYVWESANRVSSYLPIVINGANNGVTFNTNQKPRISSMDYDQYGNIQSVSKTNDVLVSYKWGYKNSLPIAEITNALPKNVFYTSFEDETTNFSFGGKTGSKSSAIVAYNKPLSGFDPGDYILSYYKFVSPAWIYTETPVVVPANGLYTITLSVGQYDEIRFYPKAAQMKTYTYNPIVGMKTETDANGLTTFYDYDALGRLKLIRDNNDHILKTYEYHYKIMN